MNDKYGIDSHKLMYHPREVTRWLDKEDIYPLYIEISPSNGCNHRCKFCSFDFTGYKPEILDYDIFEKNVPIMANGGVKAVMFGGEGEPLIHPKFIDIVHLFGRNKIDTALTTNGALLTKDKATAILPYLSWVKFSLDAGTSSTHTYLHGCKDNEFDKVMSNIKNVVKIRNSRNYKCTIGVQVVLFDENKDELINLATELRDIGVDYLVVKPFTDHQYRNDLELGINYDSYYNELSRKLSKSSTDKFSIIMRENTFKDLKVERCYKKCHAIDFWSYIDSYGEVYSCSNFLGNKKYSYGNLYNKNFDYIWKNKKDLKIDLNDCRQICRMDKINQYLDGFVNIPDGVNYI